MTAQLEPSACLICGKDIEAQEEAHKRTQELTGHGAEAEAEVTMHQRVRLSLRELVFSCSCCGAAGTTTEARICAPCFKAELIPWLEAFGRGKVQVHEVDW